MFANKSIYMNWANETYFEDIKLERQKTYLASQVIDVLRIPLFNVEGSGIITYYSGFHNGAYSYVGDEVDYYAARSLEEMNSSERLLREDYDESVCWLPIEELSYTYDPRCRPWYLNALAQPK